MPLWHTNTSRPFWCQKENFKKEGDVECHDMQLQDELFKLLMDSGSAKRRRNRSLRTFWRHEHLSMKVAVATTTTAEKVVIVRQKAKALRKVVGNGASTASSRQEVYDPHVEECQSFLPKSLKGTNMHACGFQAVTLHEKPISKSVHGLVTDQSVTPARTMYSRAPT